jgi:hypothetical protein
MVKYDGRKYSVPVYYIGKNVNVEESDGDINVYHNGDLISSFRRSEQFLNYKKDHARDILASDALSHLSMAEIDDFINNNLSRMDMLLE